MPNKIKQAIASIGVGAIIGLSIANMFPVRNDSIDDRVRVVLESVDALKSEFHFNEAEYIQGIKDLIYNCTKSYETKKL
jgi:hypothetical protein